MPWTWLVARITLIIASVWIPGNCRHGIDRRLRVARRPALCAEERLAVIMGTEGDGLSRCDCRSRLRCAYPDGTRGRFAERRRRCRRGILATQDKRLSRLMNKVILLGNVGRDPKIRFVDSRQVAEFLLPHRSGSQAPTAQEITEWHNIVVWGRSAEMAERYIRKGARLLVEGKYVHATGRTTMP